MCLSILNSSRLPSIASFLVSLHPMLPLLYAFSYLMSFYLSFSLRFFFSFRTASPFLAISPGTGRYFSSSLCCHSMPCYRVSLLSILLHLFCVSDHYSRPCQVSCFSFFRTSYSQFFAFLLHLASRHFPFLLTSYLFLVPFCLLSTYFSSCLLPLYCLYKYLAYSFVLFLLPFLTIFSLLPLRVPTVLSCSFSSLTHTSFFFWLAFFIPFIWLLYLLPVSFARRRIAVVSSSCMFTLPSFLSSFSSTWPPSFPHLPFSVLCSSSRLSLPFAGFSLSSPPVVFSVSFFSYPDPWSLFFLVFLDSFSSLLRLRLVLPCSLHMLPLLLVTFF